MSAVEEELPILIRNLVGVEEAKSKSSTAVLVVPTKNIYIGRLDVYPSDNFDGTIMCSDQDPRLDPEDAERPGHVLHLLCSTGKLGSRALRTQIPLIPAFVSSLTKRSNCPRILIACPTGNDLSVGVALALLCLYFDENCELHLL